MKSHWLYWYLRHKLHKHVGWIKCDPECLTCKFPVSGD